jgi:hypothetical protein
MIPKIIYPTFDIEQPSTNKKIKFRRFLVKEEKILLMAKESKDINDIFVAIKDVLKVCCQEPNFNINVIPLFDLEYMYLQLRSASINNIETFTAKDSEDGKIYNFKINFDDIKVSFPEVKADPKIKVNSDIIIVMKYPPASIYDDVDLKEKLKNSGLFHLVIACIDSVFNKDEQLIMTNDELVEFLDNLDVKTYKKMELFLTSTPSLKYEINYKNTFENERSLKFNSLVDFFLYL